VLLAADENAPDTLSGTPPATDMDNVYAAGRLASAKLKNERAFETFLSRKASLLWYDLCSGAAQPPSFGAKGSRGPTPDPLGGSSTTVFATFPPFLRLY